MIGNVAVDKFTVRVDMEKTNRNGGVLIGFTTGYIWDPNNDKSDNNGWYISVYDGSLFGIRTSGKGTPYSSEINNGDYITVIREGNSIRFKINKIDLGFCPRFFNMALVNKPLFPALSMALVNTSVTIVNNYWDEVDNNEEKEEEEEIKEGREEDDVPV